MTPEPTKYVKEKNSDELSRSFHERAGDISKELYKQLLSLSTGVIAAFSLLVFNKPTDFTVTSKIFTLTTITLFGLSIFFIILAMRWDASKNYFLGHINDSTKQEGKVRDANEQQKKKFNNKQLRAKLFAGMFFVLGILSSIVFLAYYLFK